MLSNSLLYFPSCSFIFPFNIFISLSFSLFLSIICLIFISFSFFILSISSLWFSFCVFWISFPDNSYNISFNFSTSLISFFIFSFVIFNSFSIFSILFLFSFCLLSESELCKFLIDLLKFSKEFEFSSLTILTAKLSFEFKRLKLSFSTNIIGFSICFIFNNSFL